LALSREVAIYGTRFKYAAGDDLFFQLFQNRPEFFFNQTNIILLGCGLELPLVFKQGGLIDVLENLAQIVVAGHAHAPERRRRNIGRIGYDRTPLSAELRELCRRCSCSDSLGKLLYRPSLS